MNLHRKIIMMAALVFWSAVAFSQKYSNGKVPTGDKSRIGSDVLRKGTKPNQILMTLGDSTVKYVDADTVLIVGGGWGKEGNAGISKHLNFIGTTDTGSFVIKVDNVKVGEFTGYNRGVGLGVGANATGNFSGVLGWNSSATALGAFAIGENNIASGTYSTCIGTNHQATSNASCCVGHDNTAIGLGSLAMGSESVANGDNSITLGQLCTSVGRSSIAAGIRTFSSGMGSAVFGTYNDIDIPADSNAINAANRLFQIGNGVNGARSNALTVLQSGNIGIGTVLPLYKLEITGNLAVGGFEKIIATFPTDGTGVDNGSIFKATTGALYYKSDGGTVTLIAPN